MSGYVRALQVLYDDAAKDFYAVMSASDSNRNARVEEFFSQLSSNVQQVRASVEAGTKDSF